MPRLRPQPQEREKHPSFTGDGKALGFRALLQPNREKAAIATATNKRSGSGGSFPLSPGERAGVRASVNKFLALLLTVASSCILIASAFAQLSIDWFTIVGGGGTSTGGVFAVSGTIGQPDASAQPLTGGNFSLMGGFWSFVAVQTPGAPRLTITLNPQLSTATVSWPSPSAGFTLQQNADLNTTNWMAAPQTVTDNGTNKFILVNPPAGNRFYRLFRP